MKLRLGNRSVLRRLGVALSTLVAFLIIFYVVETLVGGATTSVFDESGVSMGGVPANAGEIAVFSAPIQTSQKGQITLIGFQLIPVPGYQLPALVHVALLGASRDYPTSALDWPPKTGSGASTFPIKKYFGTTIRPHVLQLGLPPTILYAVTGKMNGQVYATAGVKVDYSIGNRRYSSDALDGGMLCVVKFVNFASKNEQRWCGKRFIKLEQAHAKMKIVETFVPARQSSP
jgi:hypothetical protein